MTKPVRRAAFLGWEGLAFVGRRPERIVYGFKFAVCRESRFATLEAGPDRALFGPAGIDRREMQAGRQNGEQR